MYDTYKKAEADFFLQRNSPTTPSQSQTQTRENKARIKMPSHIASPLAVSPSRERLQLITSQDFASLTKTLSSKDLQSSPTPSYDYSPREWDVPAPPPPSPVSFRHEKPSSRR